MIALAHPVAPLVRQGQTTVVRGRTRGLAGARIELEGRRPYPGGARWRVLASAPAHQGGRFVLRWRVRRHEQVGPLTVRVVAERAGRLIAATRPEQSAIGSAPIYCHAPTPPATLPAGDGWIYGGDYIEGGPYPGVYQCSSQAYTITATDQAGQVVAQQQVAAGDSYALVVPAGHYSLRASACGLGSATVTAGGPTHADIVCPVP